MGWMWFVVVWWCVCEVGVWCSVFFVLIFLLHAGATTGLYALFLRDVVWGGCVRT